MRDGVESADHRRGDHVFIGAARGRGGARRRRPRRGSGAALAATGGACIMARLHVRHVAAGGHAADAHRLPRLP